MAPTNKPTLSERSSLIDEQCGAASSAAASRRNASASELRRDTAAWARQGDQEANALRFTELALDAAAAETRVRIEAEATERARREAAASATAVDLNTSKQAKLAAAQRAAARREANRAAAWDRATCEASMAQREVAIAEKRHREREAHKCESHDIAAAQKVAVFNHLYPTTAPNGVAKERHPGAWVVPGSF